MRGSSFSTFGEVCTELTNLRSIKPFLLFVSDLEGGSLLGLRS